MLREGVKVGPGSDMLRESQFFRSDEFGDWAEVVSAAEAISSATCVAAEITREEGVRGSVTGLVECLPKIDCQGFSR
ncbi:hypothetical protein CUJ88_20080 [Paraburkholderia hospita]|jgi:hypothetical protein|nr:hypothetical protein CUJ88_20080 [Paraburkholderia hospita]SKC88131.1 hypothetical protein SAMN05445504_5288 [Burkholderia sp. CF099]